MPAALRAAGITVKTNGFAPSPGNLQDIKTGGLDAGIGDDLPVVAFTGVDAQTSMLFGYDSGAQAVLTCTLRAKSPTRAAIVGTDARIEVEGDFYAPATVTLVPRKGDPTRVESRHEGRGLRHEADEVARRLAAGETESPLMPLDETISIMETMDTVLAQARRDA